MKLPALTASVVIALVLFVAAPAGAQAPIPIGQGEVPAVALDPAGTAYIASIVDEPTITSLNFCRLPRGARKCDRAAVIAAPGTSLSRPFVQVDGDVVRVLSYRYGLTGPRFDQVFLFTSTDGGASFDSGVAVGINPFHDAVRGPGAGISLVTNAVTQGELFQRVPTDGGSAGDQRALLSTTLPYLGTVGLVDASTPLVVYGDSVGNVEFRRYSGAGNINDAASWTAPVPVGLADRPHLAGGPAGLFLLGADANGQLGVRRYQGDAGFGAPVPIRSAPGETAQDYITQDPGGRLHVLLPQITADGSRLLYATSDGGRVWTQSQIAFEPLAVSVRAAVAKDHNGVAVWQGAASPPTIYALPIGSVTPELGKTVGAKVVRGKVLVAVPSRGARQDSARASQKGLKFVPLRAEREIPVGSFLDTRRGTVELASATGRGSKTQSGQFSSGLFQVLQSRARKAKGLTELRLKGASFDRCRTRRGGTRSDAAATALSKKIINKLRADAKGKHRSRGKHSAATVRGTVWITADRCDGTLTTVKRGKVSVRDFRRKRTITLRAGQSYLARAPR